MKKNSRVRRAVFTTICVIIASVLAFASVFVCAFTGLDRTKAAVISLLIFAVVSVGGFLYMVSTSPKEDKLFKLIGVVGIVFDFVLVPTYALYTILFG